MIMWCKREYHEAFDRWKVDCYRHPDQPARISADVARMKSFEAILYYLTADPQWLEQ